MGIITDIKNLKCVCAHTSEECSMFWLCKIITINHYVHQCVPTFNEEEEMLLIWIRNCTIRQQNSCFPAFTEYVLEQ